MKTRMLLTWIVLLFCTTNLFAQSDLDNLLKELDKHTNVIQTNNIVMDNYVSKEYHIQNDPKLVEKIKKAFNNAMSEAKLILTTKGIDEADKNFKFSFKTDNGNQVIYQYNGIDNASGKFIYQQLNSKKSIDPVRYNSIEELTAQQRMLRENQRKEAQQLRKDLQNQRKNLQNQQRAMRKEQQEILQKQRKVLQKQREDLQKQRKGLLPSTNPTYVIPEDGYIIINETKVTVQEARKMGYYVQTTNEFTNNSQKAKPKFYIPEGGHITINDVKLTITQARMLGYDVETK